MNNDLRRTWAEAAVTQFDVLAQNLPTVIEELNRNLSRDSQCPGRDANPAPPEYMSESIPLDL
jgi:hypothetical protein